VTLAELRRRFLPRGPLDLLIQFAVVAAAYTAWRYARGAVEGGDMDAAFAHARNLISVEEWLHTLIEGDVQNWALEAGWPGEVARWGYANLHFKGSCIALAVVYFGWRGSFGFLRNTVIAAMAISWFGYWLYPTAPPRFIPEMGLDGSTSVTGNNPLLTDPGNALFNPFAAVPSMHVGLSIIFAWTIAMLVRPVWLRATLFAYPLLMTYVVVASGNHFWIDGLFGAFTAAAAAGVAYGLGRLHPDWAFKGPDGESSAAAAPVGAGRAIGST
jgi:hypothetical protein